MFEWMKNYFMGRFATLREKVDGYTREIMYKPLRRQYIEIEKKSTNWTITYAWRLTFQDTHVLFTDIFVVELENTYIHVMFVT